MAWVEANISLLDGSTDLIDAIDQYFDLDTAIGDQLDIIGEIVGQGRQVDFEPTGGSKPILSDEDYRVLLKAKIAKNMWDGKIDSLQSIWATIFPGGGIVIQDNQDMTAYVFVLGNFSYTVRELIRNDYIVPRPQGVSYNVFYNSDVPLFGFDLDTDFIAGFDKGYWAHDTEPIIFAFDQDNSEFSGFDSGTWSN
jgi:hypothetical protein